MKNQQNMVNIKEELQFSDILTWDEIVLFLQDSEQPPRERCPIFTL